MFNLVHVEMKKLASSKMLWMIPAGSILPAIISVLTLLKVDGVYWKGYIHTSMDTFDALAFLIFASFVSYIWAREYEEKMMEITLLYPHPKYMLLFSKVILMFFIVFVTVVIWAIATVISGWCFMGTWVTNEDLIELIKMILPMTVLHFLLVPFTFFITIVLKNILIGAILGVAEVAICYLFQAGTLIQYIPICLPMVLAHNLYGFHKVILDSYAVTWTILIGTFVVMLGASVIYLLKKWELR